MRLSEMNLPRFPLLSEKETEELLLRAKSGDKEARERLINCNLKLVFCLVQRFEKRNYELEDLFQIGTIGLIKAIDKFDLSYQVKFSTYAVPMILGEIRRFLRDDGVVKVSRSLKEKAFKVKRTHDELAKKLGREPALSEIAEATDLSREEIIASLEAVQMPGSIYDTIYQDDGDPIYVLDQLTSDIDEEPQWLDKIALKDVLKQLPEKHRRVIVLRFFQDKTQAEVATRMGLSQVQISRIERQALTKIRQLMQAEKNDGC